MIQSFDYYRQSEKPEFILCNPDDTQLCVLVVSKTECVLRYNDTSELSFVVQEGCGDGYDLLETNREVLVDGLGYFIIDSVSEDCSDGEHHGTKTVNAKSAQYELATKIVDYVNDVLPFYDSTHTSDTLSFMEHILTYMPGWTFTCDSALESKYRKIEISKQSVLDSLYSVASEAYQCVFTFDFLRRSVHADAISTLTKGGDAVQKTDIYLSFDNVIDGLELREDSDDIKTKLFVYGQDLDIRQVNPMGTAYLLNLDYYKNTNWMDSDLITVIDNWETVFKTQKAVYAEKLTSLRNLRAELTTLQAELVTLEGKKAEYDNLVSVKIEAGVQDADYDITYSEAVAQVNSYAAQIRAKEAEITDKEAQITSGTTELSAINTLCALETNFTEAQLRQLSRFLKEGEYANTNYVVTDLMSSEDIQDEAQELLEEGESVLAQLSQPSFTLTVDAQAFIHMPEFLTFTNQLVLGCQVTVEKNEDVFYAPILLEMSFSWDDKEDFSLSFGNRFHLDDAGYTYEELLGNAASTSSSISANWDSIVDFKRNYKSEVANLINNAFDVALHKIISSENQDIVWDASGLTCRKWNAETGTYEGEQFKIINNMIAFTDDSWNSLKTIIGKVALDTENPENTKYGIVAEAIVGQLLAGENLVIANEGGTFRVDGDGVFFGVQKTDSSGNAVVDEDGNPVIVDIQDYITERMDELDVMGGLVDGKISSYYQAEEPYGAILEDDAVSVEDEAYTEAVGREGDLWYDTNSNISYRYTKYETAGGKYYFLWEEFAGVPADVYDKIDGKRTIYTSPPLFGFQKDDLWIYDPDTMQVEDVIYASPSCAESKDDLLIATGDSSIYNENLWQKYSTNLSKENGSGFSFRLNNDGMQLENGDIVVTNGVNRVQLNADGGITVEKASSSASGGWEKVFYADDNGNLHLSGTLDAANGTFSGTLSAATGSFSGKLNAATGSFSGELNAATGSFKGTLNAGNGNFTVDSQGNLTANNGTFTGSCTWQGQQIDAEYLNLKGLTIKDSSGNTTFRIDSSGNVTLAGDVTLGSGSTIAWTNITGAPDMDDYALKSSISNMESNIQNAIDVANGADSTADSAYSMASSAKTTAEGASNDVAALANGTYIGSFISETTIYSPTILSDEFIVTPISTSGFSKIMFQGGKGTSAKNGFYIATDNTASNAIIQQVGSGKTLSIAFSNVEFSGTTVDFSNVTAIGLTTTATAVFG